MDKVPQAARPFLNSFRGVPQPKADLAALRAQIAEEQAFLGQTDAEEDAMEVLQGLRAHLGKRLGGRNEREILQARRGQIIDRLRHIYMDETPDWALADLQQVVQGFTANLDGIVNQAMSQRLPADLLVASLQECLVKFQEQLRRWSSPLPEENNAETEEEKGVPPHESKH